MDSEDKPPSAASLPLRGLDRGQSKIRLCEASTPKPRKEKLMFWKSYKQSVSASSVERPTWRILSVNSYFNVQDSIVNFLAWGFRTHFFFVVVALVLLSFVQIVIFAAIIYGLQDRCVGSGRESLDDRVTFVDAYQLSWTTFSTVGYGVIAPIVRSAKPQCVLLSAIMAVESFMGVIFASMAGAVVFAKINRSQSHANIKFSDPICLRFGTGVQDDLGESNTNLRCPVESFPVLEFRLVNLLCHHQNGEILDASVSVVACVLGKDEQDEETAARHRARSRNPRASSSLFSINPLSRTLSGSLLQRINRQIMHVPFPRTGDDAHPFNDKKKWEQEMRDVLEGKISTAISCPKSIEVDEGNDQLAPPRKFHKLEIETDRHPNFKRSWIIRHVLDANSPLLKLGVRQEVKQNGGCWPDRYNDSSMIRAIIRFREIIVSFSGTANVSGSSLYAQKIYGIDNVRIGYTFAPMLHGDRMCDVELLHDVRIQKGGGAETLDGEQIRTARTSLHRIQEASEGRESGTMACR